MKLEGRHINYVDHEYHCYPALAVYSRMAEEFGEEGPRRVTLAYFPERGLAELMRGNIAASIKVVYDVKHGDHPDHAHRMETVPVHAGFRQATAATPAGVHGGHLTPVVVDQPTGFMQKPGNFYLEVDEAVPVERMPSDESKGASVNVN